MRPTDAHPAPGRPAHSEQTPGGDSDRAGRTSDQGPGDSGEACDSQPRQGPLLQRCRRSRGKTSRYAIRIYISRSWTNRHSTRFRVAQRGRYHPTLAQITELASLHSRSIHSLRMPEPVRAPNPVGAASDTPCTYQLPCMSCLSARRPARRQPERRHQISRPRVRNCRRHTATLCLPRRQARSVSGTDLPALIVLRLCHRQREGRPDSKWAGQTCSPQEPLSEKPIPGPFRVESILEHMTKAIL